MRVEPAHIEQIRQASNGRFVTISADASTVAADLQQIDKGLKVRFAENGNPPFWAVYYESEDGRTTYLVTTRKAYQNRLGTWEGLDQRVVDRVREIDAQGRSGYDFARELERQNRRASKERQAAIRERLEEIGEKAAFAVRKDLGSTHRAFKPRDLPPAA
jgi:hypothetical protein